MAEFPLPGVEPIQPLGLVGASLLEVPNIGLKSIIPGAREMLPVDPLAQFEKFEPAFEDAGGAKLIDLNAREKLGGFKDPLAAFQKAEFVPIPGFEKADDLDVKSVDELDKNREGFDPVEYFSSRPEVAEDPVKLRKLLDVYRKRRQEGLTASGVAKAAIKETPGLITGIAKGAKNLAERAVDIALQPAANVVLGAFTFDLFDEKRRKALFAETQKNLKGSLGEVQAGTESATVGLIDLSRTGLRKLDPASLQPGNRLPPGRFNPPTGHAQTLKPKTDQELLSDMADDAAFRQNAADILKGGGEAAKQFGLDAETLAKEGITLDPEVIETLALTDPLTMAVSAGAFRLVTPLGKIVGTAKTLAGAKYITEKLADVAKYSTSKVAKGSGRVLTDIGKAAEGRTFGAFGLGSPLITGDVSTLAAVAGAKYIAGPIARKTGAGLTQLGKEIAGEVPRSAGLQKVLDYAVKPAVGATKAVGQGAFTGLVAGSPFAIAAETDEQAGTLLGVGAALGAGGAAGAKTFRVVKDSAARRYFGENRPVLPDVASPAYGFDAALDTQHEANVKKLSAQDASELNNFREALRQQGGEFYAMDRPSWRAKLEQRFPDATPEQLDIYENHSAFFDESQGDRKIVYLNTDTTGLRHDAGHIFDAVLAPEKRVELRKAVTDTFGQKSIDDFKAIYERKVGSKISDVAALDEYIAEQFAALFNNVPVTELNAPKSLLNKFIDTVAEGADALGIDLSAGATTPNLGAPVSVGIRKLFQNAAGEVTRRNVEGKPPAGPGPEVPPPTGPAPEVPPPAPAPTPAVAPVSPAPAPTPAVAPVSPAPAPAPSIRVTPEQVAAFKQNATPEIRADAAFRAKGIGVDYARTEAKKLPEGSPTARIIEQISDSMESGAPVVQIEHLGITSKSTPEAPLGRGERGTERKGGYEALEAAQLDVRQNAPPEIVSQYSKNFVPVRWDAQGGSPTLLAMSLDKVISNYLRLAADPKAADLIPYSIENGKFTPEGWREVVADGRAHSENQANGFKGDGGRLEVPEARLSIPAENPAYTPQPLSPERANFHNLAQGLAPPKTSRAQKGVMPGNIKGQLLAEANLRPTEIPANIPVKQTGKQAFVDFPPRTVQEVNPLRNEMIRRGVNVRDLLEVTERIRAKDIVSATPRPEINYKAPITDITRGGFQPAGEYWMDSGGKMIRAPKGHEKAAKEILGDTFKGSAVYGEMFKRGYTRIISSKEGLYVDSDKPRFSDLSSAQRAGIEDAVLSEGPDNPIEITFNGKRIGGGGPAFQPAPTEFRQKNLGGRTVEEFGEYILKASPEEWRAAVANMTGGITGGAWNLGLGLKDRGDLVVLQTLKAKASALMKEAVLADDFDNSYVFANKSQFFTEAYQAATDTGSAKAAFASNKGGFGVAKPPFPIETTTTESSSAGGRGTTTTPPTSP